MTSSCPLGPECSPSLNCGPAWASLRNREGGKPAALRGTVFAQGPYLPTIPRFGDGPRHLPNQGQRPEASHFLLAGSQVVFLLASLPLLAGFSEPDPQIRRWWGGVGWLLPGEQEERVVPRLLYLNCRPGRGHLSEALGCLRKSPAGLRFLAHYPFPLQCQPPAWPREQNLGAGQQPGPALCSAPGQEGRAGQRLSRKIKSCWFGHTAPQTQTFLLGVLFPHRLLLPALGSC